MITQNFRNGLIALVFASVTSAASAQISNVATNGRPETYRPVSPLPPELGFCYDHASTALEGALRGQAQLTHAQGNYLLSLSQAQILSGVARSLQIENRGQWIDLRVANRNRLAAERQSSLAAQRAKNSALRHDRYRAAYRLSARQFDRTTGTIAWPALLLDEKYADVRTQIDELYRHQVAGFLGERSVEIERTVERLQTAVRRDFRNLDREDYHAAQKFLRGLKYEPEFAATESGQYDLAYRSAE
jgi:hypothetical protein